MIIPNEYLKKDNKYIFPINDNTAWLTFPDFRIIYNKLFLSEIQNLESNPIPITPNKFPIVIKPIINLSGMSKGFYKINNEQEYDNIIKNINLAGYFYQPYFSGQQFNYDIIIKDGKIIDYFCVVSYPLEDGMFDYHEFLPDNNKISIKNIRIIEDLLDSYTGFINVEIIDDYIIEAHLRINGDIFIYNKENINKLINFYITKEYSKIVIPEKIYFVPFFTKKINLDFKKIEYLLKEDYILDYKFDNINSICQSKNKRFLYLTTNNLLKVKNLRKKIYSILYTNGR